MVSIVHKHERKTCTEFPGCSLDADAYSFDGFESCRIIERYQIIV